MKNVHSTCLWEEKSELKAKRESQKRAIEEQEAEMESISCEFIRLKGERLKKLYDEDEERFVLDCYIV